MHIACEEQHQTPREMLLTDAAVTEALYNAVPSPRILHQYNMSCYISQKEVGLPGALWNYRDGCAIV
jgi:hypothetical protein